MSLIESLRPFFVTGPGLTTTVLCHFPELGDRFSGWLEHVEALNQLCIIVKPDVARILLAANSGNRPVGESTVFDYRRMLTSGEFIPAHPDPILIRKYGVVQNAQHRLLAVEQSGVGSVFRIEFDCPDWLFPYLDGGKGRTLSDRVQIAKKNVSKNRRIVTACTRIIVYYRSHSDFRDLLVMENQAPSLRRVTPNDINQVFDLIGNHIDSIASEFTRGHNRVSPVSVIVAACLMHQRHPGKAIEFYRSLGDPDGLVQQARMLRDYLLQHRAKSKPDYDTYERSVYCMNCYLRDRPVKQVRCGKWES